MDSLILIEGELRSLIRNVLERVIGKRFKKKRSSNEKIMLKVATRVVSSLIAIHIFNNIRSNVDIRKYTSFILVGVFAMMVWDEYKN